MYHKTILQFSLKWISVNSRDIFCILKFSLLPMTVQISKLVLKVQDANAQNVPKTLRLSCLNTVQLTMY